MAGSRFPGSEKRWKVDLTLALIVILFGAGVVLLVVRVAPVTVVWETASEVGTAGFNIYRSSGAADAAASAWELVNPALIQAQGDEVVGAHYRYEDHDVQPGRRYQYQIEEVEWNGVRTLYPNIVQVRAGLPRMWTRIEGAALVCLAFVLWLRRRKRASPIVGVADNGEVG